jgi:hypothetical protein
MYQFQHITVPAKYFLAVDFRSGSKGDIPVPWRISASPPELPL